MLVFDCETRTDKAQALTFGSYRFLVEGRCLEEGLFYGDDLCHARGPFLERYVAGHTATPIRAVYRTSIPSNPKLLYRAAEFLKLFFQVAFKGRALVVAFNFPFDVERLALITATFEGGFLGGFSLALFQFRDSNGKLRPTRSGRITVKHIDSKRALQAFYRRDRSR